MGTTSECPLSKLHDACGGKCRCCWALPYFTMGVGREGYRTAVCHTGWQLCSFPGDGGP